MNNYSKHIFLTLCLLASSLHASNYDDFRRQGCIVDLDQAFYAATPQPSSIDVFFNELTSNPTLVEFYQPGCPPCEALSAVLNNVASFLTANNIRLLIVKVNVRAHPEFINRYASYGKHYKIERTPKMMLFINGGPTNPLDGLTSFDKIITLINKHL
jgi:thiol-disulfide isomerase/thioredoxin